jgi:DNA-directed RNA polymerase alpha subunit
MNNYTLNINTILHTKDGSKIGNAIVIGRDGRYWEITTDYGNKFRLTSEEINEQFNIAFLNYTKERDGYTCQEMQEMMSKDHKYRVETIMTECYFTPSKNTTSATICANCGKEKSIHTIGEGIKVSKIIIHK